ncbi:MAG: hypothetical protein GY754_31880 [bacterium]|nr:hypothetical protein [bacterium]
MIARKLLYSLILFSLFITINPVRRAYSQMPDWTFFKDREGHTYYIDTAGKIRITGEPDLKYHAVSIKGIDYYLTNAEELIGTSHKIEGLTLLKSILALPATNNRIYQAQARAAKHINNLKKKEGTRYKRLNEAASILLYREGKRLELLNDRMFFSIGFSGTAKVLRTRVRKGFRFRYQGISLGINSTNNSEGFDYILSIDTERIARPFRSIAVLEKSWKMNLGADSLKREELQRDENRILYRFTSGSKPAYSGFEAIVRNKNYGYIMRIITPGNRFGRNEEAMRKIIDGFKPVPVH